MSVRRNEGIQLLVPSDGMDGMNELSFLPLVELVSNELVCFGGERFSEIDDGVMRFGLLGG